MTSRYILSPEAARDIEGIKTYYLARAGAPVAREVLSQFAAAMRFLASTPGAGHRRDDLTDEDVRFWPVLSFFIVYDPTKRPIGVVRVLHAGRDLTALFAQSPPQM